MSINSLMILDLQSGWGALFWRTFFKENLFMWKRSEYLILAFCKIVFTLVNIYEELETSTLVKKCDILLLSWWRPFRKKLIVLCIMMSSIGNVFINGAIRWVLVLGSSPRTLRQLTFQVVQSSFTFLSSRFHRWHPYSEAHWDVKSVALACQEIGLKSLTIILLLTLISLVTASKFIMFFFNFGRYALDAFLLLNF